MTQDQRTASFVAAAFVAATALAAAILLLRGPDPHGVDEALAATARLAFIFFLPAYVGGALVTLFGAPFLPLAKRGRDFGLAFAAVEVVHLALVAQLCAIGAAPGRSTFILFGTAAGFVFLLALLSIGVVRRIVHPGLWWAVRLVGMNFIAYAFYVDLSGDPFGGGLIHGLYYAPFLLSLLLAVLCRLLASGLKILRRWSAWATPRPQQ
jgi:hypothetical protein